MGRLYGPKSDFVSYCRVLLHQARGAVHMALEDPRAERSLPSSRRATEYVSVPERKTVRRRRRTSRPYMSLASVSCRVDATEEGRCRGAAVLARSRKGSIELISPGEDGAPQARDRDQCGKRKWTSSWCDEFSSTTGARANPVSDCRCRRRINLLQFSGW